MHKMNWRGAFLLTLPLFVFAFLFGLTSLNATVADAGGKTTICHATGSASNPWIQITISDNAVAQHLALHNPPNRGERDDFIVGEGATCPPSDHVPPPDDGHHGDNGHH